MLEAFVIAFIHCAGQTCMISYPRPDVAYLSYTECKAQLPEAPVPTEFDSEKFEGSEIACIEVPARSGANNWIAVETTNLRSGPSVEADVIDTVKRGASFLVLARERKWLRVQTADGKLGFVWSDRAREVHSGSMASERSRVQAGTLAEEEHRTSGAKVSPSEWFTRSAAEG